MDTLAALIALGLFGLAFGVGWWSGLSQHTHTTVDQGGVLPSAAVQVAGSGTLTAGAINTMNPLAINSKTTIAHGLGAIPNLVVFYLECLTAEQGYSIGDRVQFPSLSGSNGCSVEFDATNTVILVSNSSPAIIPKGVPGTSVNLTPANWKIVALPYKFN